MISAISKRARRVSLTDRKEYLYLVLATFIWGSGHPVGKLILHDITPLQLSMVGALFGALAVAVGLVVTNRIAELTEIRGRGLALTLLAGLVVFFLYPGLSFSALAHIPASENSVLVAMSTIFVSLLAALLLDERLSLIGYGGVVAAFVGVSLVVFGTEGVSIGRIAIDFIGVSLAIIAALASAIYAVIGRRLMATYDALCVTFLGSIFGGSLQAVTVAATSGFGQLVRASSLSYALLAYWGLFSGLAYVMYYYSLAKLEAPKASSFVYLSPLYAVLLSIAILGEHMTVSFVIGMGLILTGIWMTQSSHWKQRLRVRDAL